MIVLWTASVVPLKPQSNKCHVVWCQLAAVLTRLEPVLRRVMRCLAAKVKPAEAQHSAAEPTVGKLS